MSIKCRRSMRPLQTQHIYSSTNRILRSLLHCRKKFGAAFLLQPNNGASYGSKDGRIHQGRNPGGSPQQNDESRCRASTNDRVSGSINFSIRQSTASTIIEMLLT